MHHRLYIIDVFSLLFQVFYAIPSMSSPRGEPTNAVFGLARDLTALLNDHQPSHLICAMDTSGPAARNEVFDDYKANREEAPEDLRAQIPIAVRVMEGLRVPAIS